MNESAYLKLFEIDFRFTVVIHLLLKHLSSHRKILKGIPVFKTLDHRDPLYQQI